MSDERAKWPDIPQNVEGKRAPEWPSPQDWNSLQNEVLIPIGLVLALVIALSCIAHGC
jgi:hypothetical protein